MDAGTEIPFEGVTALDHTADVGLEVEADTLPALFLRAGRGMLHLILEGPAPEGVEERRVQVEGDGVDSLLRNWLRELLYLHEVEGFALTDVTFHRLDPGALEATVRGGPDPSPPAREIKGVTLHGLRAEETSNGWFARVIFDV